MEVKLTYFTVKYMKKGKLNINYLWKNLLKSFIYYKLHNKFDYTLVSILYKNSQKR